jgi:sugar-specific transcriptional regulator TrmB
MNEMTLLEGLDLRESEARIYLQLLESGPVSIRQLASSTGINRGSVYDGLKQLLARGLVSFTQTGERRKFEAENPDKIFELINEKKQRLNQVQKAAESIVPGLSKRGLRLTGEPTMRFYEDDEGVAAILRDVLATMRTHKQKEYYAYSSRAIRQYIYRRFPNFTRQRIKYGIFVKVIAVGEGGDPTDNSERKWLREPTQEQLSSYIIIYGNKLALISVSADLTPYGVIIEEPGVAAMQKYLFTTLWNGL